MPLNLVIYIYINSNVEHDIQDPNSSVKEVNHWTTSQLICLVMKACVGDSHIF